MPSRLADVLEEARDLGFLGPGPVAEHINHARGYLRCPPVASADVGLDLGSGGGLPGLVIASALPTTRWVLVDAQQARTSFLSRAITALGLDDRVSVVTTRAEELGRDPGHRGRYDVVVARSFARPPVVAECGAAFLRVGGELVVSEPPEGGDRWPAAELAQVSLHLVGTSAGPPRLARLVLDRPCPQRYPRRVGIPVKRPLW